MLPNLPKFTHHADCDFPSVRAREVLRFSKCARKGNFAALFQRKCTRISTASWPCFTQAHRMLQDGGGGAARGAHAARVVERGTAELREDTLRLDALPSARHCNVRTELAGAVVASLRPSQLHSH